MGEVVDISIAQGYNVDLEQGGNSVPLVLGSAKTQVLRLIGSGNPAELVDALTSAREATSGILEGMPKAANDDNYESAKKSPIAA